MAEGIFEAQGQQDAKAVVSRIIARASVPQEAVVQVQQAPKEHVVHEPSPEEQEAMQMRREMDMASRTKFATGDMQRDLQLWKVIKDLGKVVTELSGGQ